MWISKFVGGGVLIAGAVSPLGGDQSPDPWGPPWVASTPGQFEAVPLDATNLHLSGLSDVQLEPLSGFGELRALDLNGMDYDADESLVTDAGFAHVLRHDALRSLDVLGLEAIGPASFAGIAGLEALEHLAVGYSPGLRMEHVLAYARLPELRSLDVCLPRGSTRGWVQALAQAPALESLRLNWSLREPTPEDWAGFAELEDIRSLTLEMSFGLGNGQAELLRLPEGLQHLGIPFSSIGAEGVALLPECDGLLGLDVTGCSGFDDHALAVALARYPKLVELDLLLTSVSEVGIASLAKRRGLRRLTLGSLGTPLGDEVAPALAKMKSLEELVLRAPGVFNDRNAGLLSKLSKLRSLELHVSTRITNRGFGGLGRLKALDALTLRAQGRLNKAELERLAKIPNLSFLEFHGCERLADDALPGLRRSKSLKWIRFVSCPELTDDGIQSLRGELPNTRIQHVPGRE